VDALGHSLVFIAIVDCTAIVVITHTTQITAGKIVGITDRGIAGGGVTGRIEGTLSSVVITGGRDTRIVTMATSVHTVVHCAIIGMALGIWLTSSTNENVISMTDSRTVNLRGDAAIFVGIEYRWWVTLGSTDR